MFLRLNESTRFRNSSQIVVADFSYLVGPRGAPFSPGGAGKRSSTLTPVSSGALDCDVLKPIHRPLKMIIIPVVAVQPKAAQVHLKISEVTRVNDRRMDAIPSKRGSTMTMLPKTTLSPRT